MTKTTMMIKMESNGRELTLGPGFPADITKITGIESSPIDIGLTESATLAGASVDGVHVKSRAIHIEASFRSNENREEDRENIIRFFNPEHPGTLHVTIGSRTRRIDYRIEGWTLKSRNSMDARIGFVVDLICPDPYFQSEEEKEIEIEAGRDNAVFVENNGDTETGFTATIKVKEETGSASGIGIGDPDINVGMFVDAGLLPDHEMTISTEPRGISVKIDNYSIFTMLNRSSTPFRIPPGGCRIYAIATQTQNNITCVLKYHERFLGI